ncbi:uncharacterized protein LOC122857111 [Aphidius gifuensis]|uniref:uncharacterized protein LOC122857111 n=1 Tax=Aphidius gifuensis TaxID=684658 RepID=UPI001CDCC9AF|nr:uncharacterized protein LOC122857111 [Aphidius gifuensis]
MAKEMMIVFVYDTSRCRKEDDDPADAVMYFHPAWVSPTQRLALAGQLMGVHHFLTISFSSPKIISLQGGKFVIKKFGQYVLAVGTDRNIHDWILQRRANCLESIIKFFHCDFDTIAKSLNNDRNKLSEKLYQMLETYLPILQYSASYFSSMPMIKLPKTASNVFLDSMQILQYCQETNPGIIGGAMFFNNKIVATQLSAELTKQLVLTDPYRIKTPGDKIITDFHLPLGVQLLRVFIKRQKTIDITNEEIIKKPNNTFIDTPATRKTFKKSTLPVSSGMKRDTSRIFTVPEEGETDNNNIIDHSIKIKKPPPPTTLPIKSSLNFDKRDIKKIYQNTVPVPPPPPLLTPSVCSTPLKDINRILHGTAVSICSANEDTQLSTDNDNKNIDDIPDVVKEALRCKRINKLKNTTRNKLDSKIKHEYWHRKSSSLSTLNDDKHFHNFNDLSSKEKNKKYFMTITDPCYPVFRQDGNPISQTLYDHYISLHYQSLVKEQNLNINKNDKNKINFDNDNDSDFKDFDCIIINNDLSVVQTKKPTDIKLDKKKSQEINRRSMSLPLKSLNAPADNNNSKITTESSDVSHKKKLDGIQLTPLMSKLSLLITDEKTSDFCSKEINTPNEYYDSSTLSNINNNNKSNNTAVDDDDGDECDFNRNENDDCYEKAELFICGKQSMVLMLLMTDGTANNPDLIHNIWQACMNNLERLESRLQYCLDPQPSSNSKELYSVLGIDSQWDTTHRSGLWGVTELDIVSSLHDRFKKSSNITDIIVRTEDTVVYGSQSGRSEIFYQQAIPPNTCGSLPTPADLMGVVPLKAKRRLERDHGIIIL